MAATATLSAIRTLARLYADERPESSDSFLTSTELNSIINLECRSNYDRIILAQGHDFYESEATFTTTSGTATKAFASMTVGAGTAADFYLMRRIQIEWGTRDIEEIPDFNKREELDFRNHSTWGRGSPKAFRVVASGIKLVPTPNITGTTIRMLYIPAFTTLASDGATFDGVNGWHDAVALGAAIKMLDLQGQDSSALVERRNEVWSRIDEIAERRAAERPHRVTNVHPECDGYDYRRRFPRP